MLEEWVSRGAPDPRTEFVAAKKQELGGELWSFTVNVPRAAVRQTAA